MWGYETQPGMTHLLTHLINRGVLHTPAVAQAMASVDRAAFVPSEWTESRRVYEVDR